MNALRVWLIHRLGGVEKPRPVVAPSFYCLKRGYQVGEGSARTYYATTTSGGLTCRCPDCKREAA